MSARSSERWAERGFPEQVSVDVLIPTCHRPAELAATLAVLAAQSAPDFAVTISDQSQDAPGWEDPAVAAMVRLLRRRAAL